MVLTVNIMLFMLLRCKVYGNDAWDEFTLCRLFIFRLNKKKSNFNICIPGVY